MDVTADPLTLLRERTSMKWRSFPADILPLFVAESDFPLAKPVAEALIAAVLRSDTGYVAPVNGLAEAFTGFAGRRWGWQVDPDQVSTTTDVSVAIVETLRLLIQPGDRVAITPPVYPPFFDLVPEAGGQVACVPLLNGQTGWTLDLDGLEHSFQDGVRAVLLSNPHNPVGHPHTAEDLTALAGLAARYGVTVVSDEVHAPLTYAEAVFTPYLAVSPEAADHGVCVTSASKAWNLAGLKCALLVTAGERMRAELAALPREVSWRTSQFGLIAGIAAYNDGESWLDGAIAALDSNRRLLSELLDAQLPGAGYRPPGASYLAWLDLHSLGWGDDPALVALEQARVALSPGPMFGEPGRGFARLNFGCSPEVLAEAVSRLAAAL
ncbi:MULTISPECIES: aminotransferase class I/II-fold pyridoxal phosphate-dependent enzyme [Cryobacterium]|uniref:cysteine-S-conjugate beta-lyase n=1 Tax=Cryobacterium breve TaxID=1259258 RepID=A0ABY2J0F5_9MICO|nr:MULTISPECIES: aminotransferase class I/II-fold pyridoxal phosphate-dependent enzyme [Cryobacterium]TFC91889.1 aminotransferase class I/II-fold pyridoxal phosphate-dependent enzyme [Cryobacterium sp. TmT3-12]TFC98440.1 aminotransferase class I/II-fold pyridoxal phosphate-dependent enzyme [Cryobacterium breve]